MLLRDRSMWWTSSGSLMLGSRGLWSNGLATWGTVVLTLESLILSGNLEF